MVGYNFRSQGTPTNLYLKAYIQEYTLKSLHVHFPSSVETRSTLIVEEIKINANVLGHTLEEPQVYRQIYIQMKA